MRIAAQVWKGSVVTEDDDGMLLELKLGPPVRLKTRGEMTRKRDGISFDASWTERPGAKGHRDRGGLHERERYLSPQGID
jgi:hypothetical protein